MKCLKRRYPTELDARIALADVQHHKDRPEKSERHAYQCPRCKGWHLTSREKK